MSLWRYYNQNRILVSLQEQSFGLFHPLYYGIIPKKRTLQANSHVRRRHGHRHRHRHRHSHKHKIQAQSTGTKHKALALAPAPAQGQRHKHKHQDNGTSTREMEDRQMNPVPLWLLPKMATEIGEKHCACVCPCAWAYLTLVKLILALYVRTSPHVAYKEWTRKTSILHAGNASNLSISASLKWI